MTSRARMSIARSHPRQQGRCRRSGDHHSKLRYCDDTEYTCTALPNMRMWQGWSIGEGGPQGH